MLVTLFGMTIVFSDEQLEKALAAKLVTLLGMTIDFSDELP
jgi:hypothetical protein